jgi:hypothetical protein
MRGSDVLPPSQPPDLPGDYEDNIETMVTWFRENFDDPANSLPYASAEGGYQWIWGGPYDAREELEQAFPDATEHQIDAATARLERSVIDWTVNPSRVVDVAEEEEPEEGEVKRRYAHHPDYPDGRPIIETVLLPQIDVGWSIHATFIPGDTNQLPGSELEAIPFGQDSELVHFEAKHFKSLVALVQYMVDNSYPPPPDTDWPFPNPTREWLSSLTRDAELFTSDKIVVYSSPPQWLDLKQLGEAGGITAIVLAAPDIATGGLVMLAWGGCRIFLRLVRNVNYIQDAFFERVAQRIRRGGTEPEQVP